MRFIIFLRGEIVLARYVHKFKEEEILKVVIAYLVDGLSHRKIQSKILGLPAPDNGGGYVVMDILHHFDIDGDKKSILATEDINSLIENASGSYHDILTKVKAYFEEENRVEQFIQGLSTRGTVGTEIAVETKQRVGQDKLRKYILDIYEHRCALCDVNKDDLLICSHIVPWRVDEQNRLNPQNAICLCAQHDKLFDKGYFSLDESYEIKFGSKADTTIVNILRGANFREPLENPPDRELLKIHFNSYCK